MASNVSQKIRSARPVVVACGANPASSFSSREAKRHGLSKLGEGRSEADQLHRESQQTPVMEMDQMGVVVTDCGRGQRGSARCELRVEQKDKNCEFGYVE